MPTEHEFKYVIYKNANEEFFNNKCCKHLMIQQGYLVFSKGMTCRVRSAITCAKNCKTSEKKWYLTFKQKVGNRVIEIEKRIDDRDGNDLWSICVGRVKKDRYVIDNNGINWEIDFFKNAENLYFVLAEVELEEGLPRIELPDFLKNIVIYEVPLTDDRFSNKKLGDVEYATNIYKELTKRTRK